jgi:hypothetical protein
MLLKYLKLIGLGITTFLMPISATLYWTMGIVVVDLITGILVSKKAGIPIQSKGIRNTAIKLCVYLLTLVLARGVEVYLTNGLVPVMNICSTIIGLGELKSVLENFDILASGSLLKLVIRAIQSRASSDVDRDDVQQ